MVIVVQIMQCYDKHHEDLVTTLYHRLLGGLEPPMGDAEYLAAFRTIVLPVARSALSYVMYNNCNLIAFMIFQFVPSVLLPLSSIASLTDILAFGIVILVILTTILITILTTISLVILIIILTSGTLPRTLYSSLLALMLELATNILSVVTR